jgi:transposase
MNAYSQDLRSRAIDLFKTGKYTRIEISGLLKISDKTIRIWVKQYKEKGNCEIATPIRVGRKRKFDDKELVLGLHKYRTIFNLG